MNTHVRARLATIALLLAGLADVGPALAASANSMNRSGAAAATVLGPLTLSHGGGDLRFGTFFPGGSGGTVVVDAAGNATPTGTVLMWNGTPPRADRFSVNGTPSASYAITTGGGTVTSGANSMSFTTAAAAPSATLDAAGHGTFDVGGTLTVPGFVPKGSYSGSYTVSIAYN